MEKKWYQSKTVLFALLLIGLASYEAISGDSSTVVKVLEALGFSGAVIGLRDAQA